MKTLKHQLLGSLVALSLLALAQPLFAQGPPSLTSHYVPGVEGIKGASLPPPGFYLRDYNVFYLASQLNNADGDEMNMDFDLMAYAQVFRPIYITKWKLLGASYGMDVIVPFAYTDLELNIPGLGRASDSSFNLSDVFVEPITLSWHGKRFDAAVGYGFYVPTGDYDAPDPTNPARTSPGKGFWTHMLTAGGTWFFDEPKTWAVSALCRYEINMENSDLDITPGQEFTLEWGVSKTLAKTIDVGLVGYYQQQVTEDNGHDGAAASDDLDHVASVGPEVNAFIPKLKLFASLRYLYEFSASDRPQGSTVTLTLTKMF
jgi:hypothetical protein